MNICIVYGKIVSEIEFKFIINVKKYYSIAIFQIELNNKSIVTAKGYNEIADWCYRNLKIKNYCIIEGYIDSKIEVEMTKIKTLWNNIEFEKLNYFIRKYRVIFIFMI